MPSIRYGSFLPLTILSVVFAFQSVAYHQSKLQILFRLYSWLINVLICAALVFCNFLALCLTEFSFMGVLVPVEESLSSLVMLSYQIKYIFYGDGNILASINYLDEKLESLNIGVPHGWNQIISFVFIIVSMSMDGLQFYKNFDYILLLRNTTRLGDLINLTGRICFIVLTATSRIYATAFGARLMVSVYFLRQRVELIRKHLLDDNRRNTAWSDHRFRPVLRTSSGSGRFREDIHYVETLTSLYFYSCTVFEDIRKFYSCFINVYVFVISTWYPVQFIINIIGKDDMVFTILSFVCTFLAQMLLLACMCVSYELKRVHYLVPDLFYKLNDYQMEQRAEICLVKCLHFNIKFDCGFFGIEIALYTVMINYVLLFVFAMLPSVYK